MATTEQTTYIAILTSPGMGHLIPLVAFAERLVQHHRHFIVTLIVPHMGPPSKAQLEILQALPETINHVLLPPVSFEDLPVKDISAATLICLTMTRSLSSLRDTLKSLTTTTKLAALIVDHYGTDAFDIANEFHVSPYFFFTASAMALSYLIHLQELDEMVSGEFRDQPEPLKVPGCVPIHGRDIMDPLQDRTSDSYKWFLHHSKRFNLAEGIIVNSFMDLEMGPLQALQPELPDKPAIYPVGPLIQTRLGSGSGRSECLQWLDNQSSGSVLFVSFGSGGTLSFDQLQELGLGLEMSGHKFLWVVRSPSDRSNAAYFSVQSQNDPLAFLPTGFLDRTKGQGLVVPSWAPQIEVLGHGSTGGFLTHCGWNSFIESVVHGVPLIAWPLYSEQKMNTIMLTEDLKVALRPEFEKSGIVGRDAIAKVIKDLMEGEEGTKLRNRTKELKDAAAKVLSQHGSSTKSLSELANKWKNKKSI